MNKEDGSQRRSQQGYLSARGFFSNHKSSRARGNSNAARVKCFVLRGNAIEETTLVAGDQDNRIVRLSLKEPSPAAPVVAYSQQNLMIISDF